MDSLPTDLPVVADDLFLPAEHEGSLRLRRPGEVEPPRRLHHHAELELNLAVSGRAEYLIRGRRVALSEDDALWLWPDREHLLFAADERFAMWVLVWRPGFVEEAFEQEPAAASPAGRSAPSEALRLPRRLGEARAAALAATAAAAAEAGSPGHRAAGLGWLLRECWAATLAADAGAAAAGTRLHPAVEEAARFLAAHAPEADDLDALAASCGLSRSRLSRLFHAQVGETLVAHRQRRRLEAALRFLGRAGRDGTPGRATLTDAALAGGFGSYAAFYRAHVRHRGVGPQAARRPA